MEQNFKQKKKWKEKKSDKIKIKTVSFYLYNIIFLISLLNYTMRIYVVVRIAVHFKFVSEKNYWKKFN